MLKSLEVLVLKSLEVLVLKSLEVRYAYLVLVLKSLEVRYAYLKFSSYFRVLEYKIDHFHVASHQRWIRVIQFCKIEALLLGSLRTFND